jgi:hypothetical protein
VFNETVGKLSMADCIKLAQEAKDLGTVSALHQVHRANLGAAAGTTVHSKGWAEFVSQLGSAAKKVRSEQDLPEYVNTFIRAISNAKGGGLLLNYTAMEIAKRYSLPMPEVMKSAVTASSFNPDTASEEDMMVYRRVTALVVAAAEGREPRIQIKVEPGVTDLRHHGLLVKTSRLSSRLVLINMRAMPCVQHHSAQTLQRDLSRGISS